MMFDSNDLSSPVSFCGGGGGGGGGDGYGVCTPADPYGSSPSNGGGGSSWADDFENCIDGLNMSPEVAINPENASTAAIACGIATSINRW